MKIKRENRIEFTSISIPAALFKKVEKRIKGTGFPSVSSYVGFVLRSILSESGKKTDYEIEDIKKRLRELGYM
jgi:metal-responsive CopG/Arc/MetJ family transcriptional regulator